MAIDDLPKPIQEYILKCINGKDYKAIENVYSLTEVIGCVRKTHLKMLNPKPIGLKSAYALWRGQLFDDAWTGLFKRNQVRCTYRLKKVPVTISGKFDFIDENGVLTDLKTHKNLYFVKTPSPDYVKQVRFYAWNNAIPKAQIVYVDMGDCKVFPIEVGDCTDLLNELEAKATELYYSLHNYYCTNCNIKLGDFDREIGIKCPSCGTHTHGKLKPPAKPVFSKEEKWHCDYCDYKDACTNSEYGKQQELGLY